MNVPRNRRNVGGKPRNLIVKPLLAGSLREDAKLPFTYVVSK